MSACSSIAPGMRASIRSPPSKRWCRSWSSIRKPDDVEEILCAGTHIVTIPPKILTQMRFHPKTEETIREFDEAWLEFTAKNGVHTPMPAFLDFEKAQVTS
jgi:hypothetical protein